MTKKNGGKIALMPADQTGCGMYRVIRPGAVYSALMQKQHVLINPVFAPRPGLPIFNEIDTVITNRATAISSYAYFAEIKRLHPRIHFIMDLDDCIWVQNPGSTYKADKEADRRLDRCVTLMDTLTATTETLAGEMRSRWGREVKILPNMLFAKELMDVPTGSGSDRLRVFWGGSNTHKNDLIPIVPLVRQTAKKYEWVFMGYVPPELRPFVRVIDAVKPADYVQRIKSIHADIGIAPLNDNRFNRSKSNVKLLEYAAAGMSPIASDAGPYIGHPCLRVKENTPKHWLKALERMEDPVAREANRLTAYGYARTMTYEANGDRILQTFSQELAMA